MHACAAFASTALPDSVTVRFVRVIGRGGFGVVKMVRAKKTGVRWGMPAKMGV